MARSEIPRRLAIAGVCVLSLAVCCGLAWWQWQRFESASGTFQNLGYVLQWPLFGLFPAFMFWRVRRLRRQAEENDDQAASGTPSERGHKPVEVPAPRPQLAPVDEDDELAAYNRYLAELAARDRQKH